MIYIPLSVFIPVPKKKTLLFDSLSNLYIYIQRERERERERDREKERKKESVCKIPTTHIRKTNEYI